jgi:hypothetical protein
MKTNYDFDFDSAEGEHDARRLLADRGRQGWQVVSVWQDAEMQFLFRRARTDANGEMAINPSTAVTACFDENDDGF